MASQQYPLHVEMEDGTEYDVTGDQRDVARWEIQTFGGPLVNAIDKKTTFVRFLAWGAAQRQELTSLTWDMFDRQCVEVTDQPEDGASDDAEDPGRTAASDEA